MLSPIEVEFDPSNKALYITVVDYLDDCWTEQPVCYRSMGLAVGAYSRLIRGEFSLQLFDDYPSQVWAADLQPGLGATMVRFRTLLLMR